MLKREISRPRRERIQLFIRLGGEQGSERRNRVASFQTDVVQNPSERHDLLSRKLAQRANDVSLIAGVDRQRQNKTAASDDQMPPSELILKIV